jgi:hypothetical protein
MKTVDELVGEAFKAVIGRDPAPYVVTQKGVVKNAQRK